MIQVEILRAIPDEVAKLIRYDVKAEIPGLYTEIVSYCCPLATDCEGANEAMSAARTFALGVLRARLSLWAAQPEQPIGSHPGESPAGDSEPRRRRRRTKAEIEAEAVVTAPVPEPVPEPQEPAQADSAQQEPIQADSAQQAGERMERKPEHEQVLRALATETYGPHWAANPTVRSNVVVFASHAIANRVMVLDGNGKPHPQIRALFQQMVVSKCPVDA